MRRTRRAIDTARVLGACALSAATGFSVPACGGNTRASLASGADAAVDGGVADVEGGVPSCTSGAPCTSDGDECKAGVTSCAAGAMQCAGLTNVVDGTPCGINQFCDDGTCVACAQGVLCNPGGNVCETGVTSCASGSSICTPIGNAPNGSVCGTGEVCSNGVCTACDSGMPCNPDGNTCRNGSLSCSAGTATCVETGEVADGTACGAGGICSAGLCVTCSAGAACVPGTPPNSCEIGATSCNGGVATCSSTGPVVDGTPCGQGTCVAGECSACASDAGACLLCQDCPSGSSCIDSQCSLLYGNSVGFSPCGGGTNAVIPPNVLIGQLVTLPAAKTVTALGMIGNPGGGNAIMALYSSSGGLPSTLETESAPAPVGSGMNVYPVSSIGLGAGSYWVMVEVSSNSTICDDGAASTTLVYGGASYGTLPQSFSNVSGGPTTIKNTVAYNFFVVVAN